MKLVHIVLTGAVFGLSVGPLAVPAQQAGGGQVDPRSVGGKGLLAQRKMPTDALKLVSFAPRLANQEKTEDKKEAAGVKAFGQAMRIAESKPVTVNHAKFALAAQIDWNPPMPDNAFPRVAPVKIQLHITNLANREVLFRTSGTYTIRLWGADGKEVKRRLGKPSGVSGTKPIVLARGASYALLWPTELRWNDKSNAAELVYFQGTGPDAIIGPLAPGRYKLVVSYAVAPDNEEKEKLGDVPTWFGEVDSKEVSIEVVESKTTGYGAPKREVPPLDGPIRVLQSVPSMVKEAKFAVVAQSNWQADKNTDVPIDIQLRLTNSGKNELVFSPLFSVNIKTKGGDLIRRTWIRKSIRFPTSISLPPGTTFALTQKVVLHWEGATNTGELICWGGTGVVFYHSPLDPGRYKLCIGYAGEFSNEVDFELFAPRPR